MYVNKNSDDTGEESVIMLRFRQDDPEKYDPLYPYFSLNLLRLNGNSFSLIHRILLTFTPRK